LKYPKAALELTSILQVTHNHSITQSN